MRRDRGPKGRTRGKERRDTKGESEREITRKLCKKVKGDEGKKKSKDERM